MIRAKEVIQIARARGLEVALTRPPVRPVLVRPDGTDAGEVTPVLMEALKAWRLEIIEELTKG